jgi:GNAT superfamily N-acetyltransferase
VTQRAAYCIRAIGYGSDEYHAALRLRRDILRKPLGLDFAPAELERESGDFHVAAFCDNELVACLVLSPLSGETFKMLQVAVAGQAQGQGIGKQMVLWAEEFARTKGCSSLSMSARESAAGFYERLGYSKSGDRFEQIGLPHWKMEKRIG